MKKTINDYMKDTELSNEPQALREIHAIRLMIQDETKGMSAAERTTYYNISTDRFFNSDNKPKMLDN